ncbi:MAG: cupin domain-containing protein [Alphaproteobacteria bacterium]|nr:cupin domain-containing protein [Alphaproteobacteria bacterium]
MTDTHPPAQATLQVEDERVRVTEWRFPPGSATGWHRHAMPYVVVPIAGGRLRMDQPDGSAIESILEFGKPYSRPEGVEHNVVNIDDHEVAFIEVELKSSAL